MVYDSLTQSPFFELCTATKFKNKKKRSFGSRLCFLL